MVLRRKFGEVRLEFGPQGAVQLLLEVAQVLLVALLELFDLLNAALVQLFKALVLGEQRLHPGLKRGNLLAEVVVQTVALIVVRCVVSSLHPAFSVGCLRAFLSSSVVALSLVIWGLGVGPLEEVGLDFVVVQGLGLLLVLGLQIGDLLL